MTAFYSPLRYPGGKNKLSKFISQVCIKNDIKGEYIEPYAGGAAVALFLLMEGYVSSITINDFDRSIFALWYSILNYTDDFCRLIKKTKINIKNWKKFKSIQKNKQKASLLELGFSTFFLNRTNISGIIEGGVIGGIKQKGNYKIDCRFNKENLITRIKDIAQYKDQINVYNLDAIDLIKKLKKKSKNSQTIFYFDPPYYVKGESLYFNHYKHDDHEKVCNMIKKIKNAKWIVSYDDTDEIKKLYSCFRRIEYSLTYTANKSKKGKEVLFLSDNLIEPELLNLPKFANASLLF